MIAAWILSPLLLSNHILLRVWSITLITFQITLNIATLIAAIIYHIDAAGTFWEVLASSSPSEIKEFLSTLPWQTVLFSLLGLAIGAGAGIVSVVAFTRKKYKIPPVKYRSASLNFPFLLCFVPFTAMLFCYFFIFNKPAKILKKSIALQYIHEFLEFQERMGAIKNLNSGKPPYESLKMSTAASDMIGVIVIGESAHRDHLGCYGYPRNTTPYFSQIKDKLLLFDNILSASCVTPDAIKYIFTNAELRESNFKPTASIPQLLRHLNAEVYYISNQGRWSGYNMPQVILFEHADENIFYNTSMQKVDSQLYDESVLHGFSHLLNKTSNHRPRFIFIHLIGSHSNYSLRVPDKEVLFRTEFRDHLSYDKNINNIDSELNAYDSSIAYTDKILKEIITKLEQKNNSPAFLLYFSDHGEVLNATGKNKRSYQCTRIEAYEIPFVVWTNQQYDSCFPDIKVNGKKNLHKLAQTDRIFPSLCSLMQISWQSFPHSKNIFSTFFEPANKVYSAQGKSTNFTDKNGHPVVLKKCK